MTDTGEITEDQIEAACCARFSDVPGQWCDGFTPGMASLERMLAERMLRAATLSTNETAQQLERELNALRHVVPDEYLVRADLLIERKIDD